MEAWRGLYDGRIHGLTFQPGVFFPRIPHHARQIRRHASGSEAPVVPASLRSDDERGRVGGVCSAGFCPSPSGCLALGTFQPHRALHPAARHRQRLRRPRLHRRRRFGPQLRPGCRGRRWADVHLRHPPERSDAQQTDHRRDDHVPRGQRHEASLPPLRDERRLLVTGVSVGSAGFAGVSSG